jgi:hypothetical protein
MPKALDVPWDKIRESCEKGTPLREVAKLFAISDAAVRMRSNREGWNTPKRVSNRLNKAAGLHNDRVARNQSVAEQLEEGKAPQNLTTTATDLEGIAKEYRNKAADKLFRILTQTVIAPPRTWKDFDIADKMMRRTLGMDDGEGKSNTIVQLQVVNDRLRGTLSDDIVEGDFVDESVTEASPSNPSQSELTGFQSVLSSSAGDEAPPQGDQSQSPSESECQ